MKGKKALFEDDEAQEELTVNKDFAAKFERRERRKEMEKLAQQAAAASGSEDEESSSGYSQDSEGDLINDKIGNKFMKTMVALRKGEFDTQQQYFSDDDFDFDEEGLIHSKTGKTYKDLVREEVAGKMAGEASQEEQDYDQDFEERRRRLETPNEQEARLRSEFLAAADGESHEEEEHESEEGDGFLKVKEKKQKGRDLDILEKEDVSLGEFMAKNEPKGEMKVLQEFWGKQDMDRTDKFLRNYILAEAWKGGGTGQGAAEVVDLQDELRESEMEDYEERYNFRYQEKQGANIVTHARNTEDTLRIKDTARKLKRAEVSQRKKEEKKRKLEQLKRLRELKQAELDDKVKQVEQQAGLVLDQQEQERIKDQIQSQFDPQAYDLAMDQAFDEAKEASENEQAQDFAEEGLDDQVNENVAQKGLWYVCDQCLIAIKPGKPRFQDSNGDFTLCAKCFKKNPQRKLKKLIVPKVCKPPADADQIISREFLACVQCKKQLAGDERVIKGTLWSETEQALYCKKCGKDRQDLRKFTEGDLVGTEEETGDMMKKQLEDQYEELEYQDLIGGNLPTRFKYEQVERHDFGLEDEELLYLNDKSLNSLVSLKKLAPYRRDPKVDLRKVSFQKKKFKGELKAKKKEMKSLRKERAAAKQSQRVKFRDFVEQEQEEDEERTRAEENSLSTKPKSEVKTSRRAAYGI